MKYECGDQRKFFCPLCPYKATQKTTLAYHMVIEENGACKYQCLSCNKVYKHKFILNRHQRYECGDRRPFRCFLCPYSAKQKKSLKIHLLTKHKDVTLPVEL
ncbi:zinc finger X-chromosomal protein-like [Homalodisca vitripennis]|uniref:zinc finger X-chromosomal protein-like n=1 Tax=Homalodisca vitripennis TaxID=197043 RepID=UPI001EEB6D0B|nr:zinc finger X-chromosomal protein-like [Homalodisca vitripennis]